MPQGNHIFTVSELTRRIKGVVEQGFTNVSVQGDISNLKHHASGHLYFTLKDEHAQLQAVLWRSRVMNLFFTPQDGMKIIARGNITVYEVRGIYQIDVIQLQPLGVGELQMAFERLKQKLSALGYFNPEHKKALPRYPERIGIVTSPTGAAIQDILNILSRRCPCLEVTHYPVNVQGAGAASEIATAIRDFNEYGNVDVMIVGRGGGSLEDLWAFNEEIVARAIYESRIPIISAVGHEIDFTIADLVADLRAPTPSAAAELVIPSRREMVEIVRNYYYNIEQFLDDFIQSHRKQIAAMLQSYSFNKPLDITRQYSQHVDELQRALFQAVSHHFVLAQQKLHALDKRIASVSPSLILKRGYTIISRNGEIVDSARKLHRSDGVQITYHDGKIPAIIQ